MHWAATMNPGDALTFFVWAESCYSHLSSIPLKHARWGPSSDNTSHGIAFAYFKSWFAFDIAIVSCERFLALAIVIRWL